MSVEVSESITSIFEKILEYLNIVFRVKPKTYPHTLIKEENRKTKLALSYCKAGWH